MSKCTETLKQDLDRLTEDERQQVSDFIAFLKFRHRRHRLTIDPSQLISLAGEFAAEDRILAEAGMGDYTAMLDAEDRRLRQREDVL
jgi:hypothetical protein